MQIQLFGIVNIRAARQAHLCWLCGEPIPTGSRYSRLTGTVNNTMFAVKTCKARCEVAPDFLDQNPALAAPRLHHTTFSEVCNG